jgi:hypothetical protein
MEIGAVSAIADQAIICRLRGSSTTNVEPFPASLATRDASAVCLDNLTNNPQAKSEFTVMSL